MSTQTSDAAKRAAAMGVSPLSPYLICADAAGAIDFYKAAFGAEEMMAPLKGPNGQIMHASLSINGGSVMLSDEFCEMGMRGPKTLGGSPVTIHVIVDDADASVARAEAAGATVVMPVSEQFWGDRYGVVTDPFGHSWSFATPVRTLSGAELEEAARAAMAS